MRWYKKKYRPEPNLGASRSVRKYLIFPKCVNGQYRWLEMAVYEEQYVEVYYPSRHSPRLIQYKTWAPRRWLSS